MVHLCKYSPANKPVRGALFIWSYKATKEVATTTSDKRRCTIQLPLPTDVCRAARAENLAEGAPQARPRSVDRTLSPAAVSRKRNSGMWPETFGVFWSSTGAILNVPAMVVYRNHHGAASCGHTEDGAVQ
jgi:hypothetical protein